MGKLSLLSTETVFLTSSPKNLGFQMFPQESLSIFELQRQKTLFWLLLLCVEFWEFELGFFVLFCFLILKILSASFYRKCTIDNCGLDLVCFWTDSFDQNASSQVFGSCTCMSKSLVIRRQETRAGTQTICLMCFEHHICVSVADLSYFQRQSGNYVLLLWISMDPASRLVTSVGSLRPSLWNHYFDKATC